MTQKSKIYNLADLQARRPVKDVMLDDNAGVRIQALPAAVLVNAAENPDSLKTGAMLVKSLVDENGQRLFKDGEEEDALNCIDSAAMHKIIEGINALNGFNKAVKDAEKN